MSSFTNNIDNITSTALIPPESCIFIPDESCTLIKSSSDKVGNFAFPVPEKITECSPKATFTTYKMGGSTGISGKENQDACSVVSIKKNGTIYAITTVCDGHGIYGQSYSNIVVTKLPQLVIQHFEEILVDPFSILKKLFSIVNENLKTEFKFCDGGTTATITILADSLLIVANVGDCEALLKTNSPNDSVLMEKNGVRIPCEITDGVIRATIDHNANNLSEVSRVIELGAEIKYATQSYGHHEITAFNKSVDDNGDVTYIKVPHSLQKGGFVTNMSREPAIYIHGGSTLNMTRSLGDWKAWFLSAEPDVTRITWPTGVKARLLVASDGYFNCFSKQDQNNELSFELSPSKICERGHETVGKTFGYSHADNTTIAVLDTFE